MRLVLGSDHAGYELKQVLVEFLRASGHEVVDVGTCSTAAVDYPDFAEAVAAAVLDGRAERGVLICGSGVGACVAAIRYPESALPFATMAIPPTRAWNTTTECAGAGLRVIGWNWPRTWCANSCEECSPTKSATSAAWEK